MASCSRAGATLAEGSRRPSALSTRDCTSPIHAANDVSVILAGSSEGLQDFAFEDLHLLLRDLEALLAHLRELEPALVRGERLLQGELPLLHARHDLFELGEGLLEAELPGCFGHRQSLR